MSSTTTYSRDEIVSSSVLQKSIKPVLDSLKNEKREKVAIARNNQIEAVMIPVEDYERFEELEDLIEHIEIYNIVQERKNEKATIPFEKVIAEYGL